MSPLLSIRDLRVEFETDAGAVAAVRGVDLDIQSGETVALVGESGCGKSVTAVSVMRLMSGRIAGGSSLVLWTLVLLAGRWIGHLS